MMIIGFDRNGVYYMEAIDYIFLGTDHASSIS